jgi:hypothetical protein
MKLQFKNSPTIASEDMAVSKMGIAQGAGDMLSGYLRDKIYSNKVLACIRETITNSQDEHIKYAINRAVDVKIENINGQYIWSSRDYAKGLSEEAIRTVYGMYGGSDKRDNNNQVGGFGIGALAPFAVSDSFYITSYHNGYKTQYACILGAGEHGVSVGEIYKVSDPEPTDESGLEVSLDVSKNYYDFNDTTIRFVTTFLPDAKIVYTDIHKTEYTPTPPSLTKEVDGYTFNLYENDFGGSTYSANRVAIRMGGVVYRMRSDLHVTAPNGKIVVDVPIGKLTIPISREDIEDTSSNRKVLDEIQTALDKIADEDKAKIVIPKFGKHVIENDHSSNYGGEWFTYTFSQTFPDSWNLKKKIEFVHGGYNHNISNDNYIVYLIPDIKSYRSWVKRLDAFLASAYPNTQFMWMKKPATDIVSTDTLDVSDVLFVDVKKLNLPKLPKQAGTAEYIVSWRGKKHSYTAEDLDEYVTENFFSDEGISDGWEKKIDCSDKLRRRVISLCSDYGARNCFWACNSKKMYEQLIALGWFTPSSKEYVERVVEIKKLEQAKVDEQHAEHRVTNVMFKIVEPSKRTVRIIRKSPDKLDRLRNAKTKITQETSFRARLLNILDNVYYSKITREDLRKILNMK